MAIETIINLMMAPYGKKPNGEACPPLPTQKKVLEWVDKVKTGQYKKPGIPILYLQGGVGSGKTRAILAPALELLEQIIGLRALWGRQDFNDLKTSIIETFLEVLPDELISNKNETYHWYDIAQNGEDKSRLYFNGLKDLTGLGSQEFGLILISEVYEISLIAFRTLKQRLRQSNMPLMILMEGNPPNDDHWLKNCTNPSHPDYDSDIEMWEISSYENWDNLSKAYRESLENMPESWKSKYLYGKFGFTPDGTPFYSGFKETLHKTKLTNKPEIIYRSWDFGFNYPACSFHSFDSKGRWLIVKEIMGSNITIQEFGNYVKLKSKEWYPTCAQWVDYGDPAGLQKTDKSEKTSVEILQSLGIYVTCKQSTYRERKEIIERKLTTLIDGIPSLLIDDECKITIDGFLGGYHYPVRKQHQSYNPHLYEIPFKDGYYEHLLNTVEYFAVNQFSGVETTEDEKELSYRIVGDLKDIKFDDEENSNYSAAYEKILRGS